MAKMFAGIHALHLIEADGAATGGDGGEGGEKKKSHVTHVGGMASREGEVVLFEEKDRVSLAQDPQVKAWLRKVESQMRLCLAALLARAVDEKGAALGGDDAAFLAWVDRYAAQTVLLAAQGTPNVKHRI